MSMESPTVVGLFGLGIMGSAIAVNLLAAGFAVAGYDPDAKRRADMAVAGIDMHGEATTLPRTAPVLLSSLPGEAALEATVAAILASGAVRCTLVEMSTLRIEAKVEAAERLAAHGHLLLDCPLSGTGAQARNRDLTVYASGDPAVIKALAPVFEGFARTWFDLGALGNGSRMKYVANLLVAIHNLAAAEAIVLARRAGLDPAQVVDVVKLGAGGSRMLEVRGPMMAAGCFTPVTAGFPLYEKDLKIIGDFAAGLGAPTPLLSATLPFYEAGAAQFPDADVAALSGVLERLAGTTNGPS